MLARSHTISGPGDERARSRHSYRRDAVSPVQPAKLENQTMTAAASTSDDNNRSQSSAAASLIISGDREKSENQATAVDGVKISTADESEKGREGSALVDGDSENRTSVPVVQVSAADHEEEAVEGEMGAELKASADSKGGGDTAAVRYMYMCTYM